MMKEDYSKLKERADIIGRMNLPRKAENHEFTSTELFTDFSSCLSSDGIPICFLAFLLIWPLLSHLVSFVHLPSLLTTHLVCLCSARLPFLSTVL